jgi:hypothetical protein
VGGELSKGVGFAPTAPRDESDELPATPPLSPHRMANSIRRHGFLAGGAGFIGTAFGAAGFLGFFFSLFCELLPLPIVIASIPK